MHPALVKAFLCTSFLLLSLTSCPWWLFLWVMLCGLVEALNEHHSTDRKKKLKVSLAQDGFKTCQILNSSKRALTWGSLSQPPGKHRFTTIRELPGAFFSCLCSQSEITNVVPGHLSVSKWGADRSERQWKTPKPDALPSILLFPDHYIVLYHSFVRSFGFLFPFCCFSPPLNFLWVRWKSQTVMRGQDIFRFPSVKKHLQSSDNVPL